MPSECPLPESLGATFQDLAYLFAYLGILESPRAEVLEDRKPSLLAAVAVRHDDLGDIGVDDEIRVVGDHDHRAVGSWSARTREHRVDVRHRARPRGGPVDDRWSSDVRVRPMVALMLAPVVRAGVRSRSGSTAGTSCGVR